MIQGQRMWPTVFRAKAIIEANNDTEASQIGRKVAGTIKNFEIETQTDV